METKTKEPQSKLAFDELPIKHTPRRGRPRTQSPEKYAYHRDRYARAVANCGSTDYKPGKLDFDVKAKYEKVKMGHTAEAIEPVIRNLARMGMRNWQIAKILGMSKPTFLARRKDYPRVESALLEGRSLATQNVVNRLYETAMGGRMITTITEKRNKRGKLEEKTITRSELPPNPNLLLKWLHNRDPENWKSDGKATVNLFGIINSDLAQKDIKRIERVAGSFANGRKRVESTEIDSEGSMPSDSD